MLKIEGIEEMIMLQDIFPNSKMNLLLHVQVLLPNFIWSFQLVQRDDWRWKF